MEFTGIVLAVACVVLVGLNYWMDLGLIAAGYAILASFWGGAHDFLGVIFVVGTLPFFLFMLADIGLLMYFMDDERERGGPSALVVLGTLLLFQFFGDFKILTFAYEHFGKFALYAVIYLVFGFIWIFPKAIIVSRKYMREGQARLLESFLCYCGKVEKDLATDVGLQKEWAKVVQEKEYRLRWNPLENKKRISIWFFHWPWNILSTFLNDFISELFNFIYDQIESTLKKIADYQFRSQLKYMPPKENPVVVPKPSVKESGVDAII